MKTGLLFILLFFVTVCPARADVEVYADDDAAPVFDKDAAARRGGTVWLGVGVETQDLASPAQPRGSAESDVVTDDVAADNGEKIGAVAAQESSDGQGDGDGDAAERRLEDIWQGRAFGAMFDPVIPVRQNSSVPAEARPVVNVIVNALPSDHFSAVFKELSRLKKIYNAQIGRVIVLGLNRAKKEDKRRKQEELIAKKSLQHEDFEYLDELLVQEKLLDELGLKNKGSIDFEEMLGKFNVGISPSWIIRHEDVDYVYEGINNPSKLFTGKGEFKEDFSLRMNVAGDSPDNTIVRERVRGVSFYKERPERPERGGAVKQPIMWDAIVYE